LKRHALSTRLWHWGNLVCVVILFMSGLTISNAHPRLYWGEWGFAPAQAWLMVPRFPDWMTIPGYYNLAAARSWHVLIAWPFALLLLFAWAAMLRNRHFAHDLATSRREWAPAAMWGDVKAHLRFDFDHGSGKYNFLQKLSYGLVLGVLLPGLVFTGIAISPGMGPSFAWMIELMGGRQSARSLHFLFAWGLFAFFVVHVLLVLVTNPLRQMGAMLAGGRQSEA
jgi:thiosulfate reductase cytochrome b subunit